MNIPVEKFSATGLGLTERQMEVLALMMEGKSNKAICRELGVAETTAKIHVSAILKSLNVANRTQAVIAAAAFAKPGEAAAPLAGKASFATPAPVDDAAHPATLFTNKPSIAVLPFVNMSDDPEQDYFSEGISEDIITALSKLRWFLVIARNSSFTYKGKSVHIKQVGQELGVGYVVEGSVRRSGNRVRITAQLNHVATGSHLWAEHYDRALSDVFTVQDEITDAVVAAIEPQIYAAENFHSQRKPPESLDAWDLLMRALSHYWRMTRDDNLAAQALLNKAIAIAPNHGPTLGVLAFTHVFGAQMGWEDKTVAVPTSERLALAAIRADGEDPWAHLALACVHKYLARLDDALAEFEWALSLNPNFSLAHAYYGLVLTYVGRWQDGSNAARRALRLSPRGPFSAIYTGVAAYAEFAGHNYAEAIRLAREALRARPDFVGGHRVLTAAAGLAGDIELARASLRELRRAQPNISLAWMAQYLPLRRQDQLEQCLEGMRRAGLN